MSKWHTVSEIENKTGIPHQTIRRYMKNHSHHLIMKKEHKSYLISDESIKVLVQIRDWYSEGMKTDQVDEALVTSGIRMSIDVHDNDEQVSINMAKTLQDLRNSMRTVEKQMNEQMNFNKALVEKLKNQDEQLKDQQQYIERSLNKRDEILMQSLREMQETKKLIASTQEEKKKNLFSKIFRK